MRKSKTKKKSSNKGLIIGLCISLALMVAIIVSVMYKNETAKIGVEDKETPEIVQPRPEPEQDAREDIIEEPKKEEEQPKVDGEPKQQPEKTTNGYIEGQTPAIEPTYIAGVLLVNKKNPLPATYNIGEDKATRTAFEKMAAVAKQQGFELVAFSGFRSYEYQTTLYNNYVTRDGQQNADRYSARPGYSEHQSGLAFDIGEKGKEDLWLTSEFGETKAGKWLVDNAHKYGFILRYPEGKEEITGFMYESWHFRYLGEKLALKVYESGVTLEEYLEVN